MPYDKKSDTVTRMYDEKGKPAGLMMEGSVAYLGDPEKPKSINEAQYKMLKDKFIMSSTGDASISGVTGERVDVKKSFDTFDEVHGEDTEAKVKAAQDLYSGLAERSKGEVKEGLGPYKPLFN